MSYDYDALVQEFTTKRQEAAASDEQEQQQEHLQAAVQALETLSSHCPMTPLLWIQYAATLRDWLTAMGADKDTVQQSHRQILALGIVEFPGSLLLQCRHVQACWDEENQDDGGNNAAAATSTKEALDNAIQVIGRGAYRSEPDDVLVAWLYRTWADWCLRNDTNDEACWDAFVHQARVPLPCNQSLAHTMRTWGTADSDTAAAAANTSIPPHVEGAVEEGRRWAAQIYGASCGPEDEVQAEMHQQGIESAVTVLFNNTEENVIDWTSIEIPTGQQRFGMGFGGAALAKAFSTYASSYLQKSKSKKNHKDDDDDDDHDEESSPHGARKEVEEYRHNNLPWNIYERGVAECPTVESLWLSYLHDLLYHGTVSQKQQLLPQLVQRACRNCPYSVALVRFDLDSTLQLAQDNVVELEPDVLLERVETAWNRKFLPGGTAMWCDLQLAVVSVVRQRLLSMLFPAYDEDDKKQVTAAATTTTPNWNDDTREEVEDLCSDLKELFEAISNKLHEQFPDYTAGRIRVMQEQALTEYHLTKPLAQFLQKQQPSIRQNSAMSHEEAIDSLAKTARLHAHPDTFLTWIHFWQYNKTTPTNPACVVQSLAKIRCAFLLAWQQVSPKAEGRRDFPSALSNLAHEWTQWESLFGSSKSLKRAQHAVQKKYRKMQEQEQRDEQRRQQREKKQRRKRPAEETTPEPSPKKVRVEEPENEPEDEPQTKTVQSPEKMQMEKEETAKQVENSTASLKPKESKKKKTVPKVTINGIEYPTHPFTVRLSNLSEEVEDMDLVDLLKPRCGAVVHARIVREKGHGRTKSKGWGLVQFEETDSVEKALALSGELGLHEKLVTIERSNAPAVMLVPPGMHRLKPKGEGRNSKRNEKKRERNQGNEARHETDVKKEDAVAQTKAPAPTPVPRPSVLSLAPRGLMKKGSRPKAKLNVPTPGKQEKK